MESKFAETFKEDMRGQGLWLGRLYISYLFHYRGTRSPYLQHNLDIHLFTPT